MKTSSHALVLLPALLLGVATLGGCQLTQQRDEPSPATAATPGDNSVASQSTLIPEDPAAQTCTAELDIWSRLRAGFRLSDYDHQRNQAERNWYLRHPSYMTRVAERAAPYLHMVVEAVEERGMPMEIALLPVVESAFQPFAYSHGRAAGLWQFVPGTGKRFGLRQTWWYDGRRDVAESTRAALEYLEYLHGYFDDDWLLALAAYNSGEGTVRRAIRRNQQRGLPTDYWSLDLPQETKGYVPKLLAFASLVENPAAYNIEIPTLPDEPFLEQVEVGSQIDLDLAAELAGISVEDIYRYNPGFNRWATDPEGPHRLLVPGTSAETFRTNLAQYPSNERISWKRHRIAAGESLGTIAQRYHTTVALIRQVNDIRGNTIRAGQTLIIPAARTDLSRYSLSASARLEQTQSRERDGTRVEYRVKAGDSFWGIARRFGVGVNQLAKWNGLAPRDTLRPGQLLVVWTTQDNHSDNAAELNPASFTHPFEQNTRQRITYTVRQGDSLYTIAQRFRVTVNNLKEWNGLHGRKYLQPGQRLKLYVDVTRQSGTI